MTLGLLDDSSEPDPLPTELTGGTFLARADSSGRECWRETVRHPFLRLKLIDPSAYTDLDTSKPLIAEPAFDQGEHCEQLGSPDLLERHPPPAVVAIGDYLRPTADSLRKDKAELCTRHTHLEPPRHKAPSPSRVDPDATGTRWQRPLETYPLPGVQAQVLSLGCRSASELERFESCTAGRRRRSSCADPLRASQRAAARSRRTA